MGLLGIIIKLFQDQEISSRVPSWVVKRLHLPWREDLFSFAPKLYHSIGKDWLATSNLFAMLMFVFLCGSLFYFARKKLG
jgi:hypothetical protein